MSQPRRRIVSVEMNEDGTTGGSYRSQFDFIRHLDHSRYEPVVVFYQANRYVDLHRKEGTTVHVLEEMRTEERRLRNSGGRISRTLDMVAGAILRRRRFLKEVGADLLHLNNSPEVGADDWLPAARLLRIPCVVSARCNPPTGLSFIHRSLVERFDRILIISDHVMRGFLDAGYPRNNLTLVTNGVDLGGLAKRVTRSREETRAALEIPPGKVVAAMVGNLREWKGQHVVLEALALLDPALRNQLLILFVGVDADLESRYFQRLQGLVAKHGLEDMVRFLGSRTDVPDLFTASDFALHASVEAEPFGLVVVEAMALGVPVVATRLGAPADVVTEASGLLFDPSSPDDLACALTRMTRDPETRKQLAAGARIRSADFSIEGTARAHQKVYEELLPN